MNSYLCAQSFLHAFLSSEFSSSRTPQQQQLRWRQPTAGTHSSGEKSLKMTLMMTSGGRVKWQRIKRISMLRIPWNTWKRVEETRKTFNFDCLNIRCSSLRDEPSPTLWLCVDMLHITHKSFKSSSSCLSCCCFLIINRAADEWTL